MNTEKWSWMMEYCKKNRLPPTKKWALDKAEKEYLKKISEGYYGNNI